jgi:hypothetical protein
MGEGGVEIFGKDSFHILLVSLHVTTLRAVQSLYMSPSQKVALWAINFYSSIYILIIKINCFHRNVNKLAISMHARTFSLADTISPFRTTKFSWSFIRLQEVSLFYFFTSFPSGAHFFARDQLKWKIRVKTLSFSLFFFVKRNESRLEKQFSETENVSNDVVWLLNDKQQRCLGNGASLQARKETPARCSKMIVTFLTSLYKDAVSTGVI